MAKTGCPACHTPPKDHPAQAQARTARCATRAGAKFVFKHPSSGELRAVPQAAADATPRSPANVACVTVPPPARQARGSSPTPRKNADCSACHRPPANHFPGTCAPVTSPRGGRGTTPVHQRVPTCHKRPRATSRPALRATIDPASPGRSRIRAPASTASSFPCANCHPSGPPAVYCTCHKGRPPTGDDRLGAHRGPHCMSGILVPCADISSDDRRWPSASGARPWPAPRSRRLGDRAARARGDARPCPRDRVHRAPSCRPSADSRSPSRTSARRRAHAVPPRAAPRPSRRRPIVRLQPPRRRRIVVPGRVAEAVRQSSRVGEARRGAWASRSSTRRAGCAAIR